MLLCACAALVAYALLHWRPPQTPAALDAAPPRPALPTPQPTATPATRVEADTKLATQQPTAASVTAAALPALPPAVLDRLQSTSLRGSLPDGDLRFGDDARLLVDADLRRHLDWWLALLGELPLEVIRSLFQQSLQGRFDRGLAEQALAFFDRWVDYLRAADALGVQGDTQQRLQALSALRRQWFGEDAEALFGDEERYTRHVLARQALLRDDTLSPQQRAEALAALEQTLDPTQQAMRAAALDPLLASEQSAQFERLQIDPQQRHAERSALFGTEAADRLAALDQQRADWAARVQAVRQQLDAWQQDPAIDVPAREQRLQQLLQRDFSEAEQRRVRALLALPPTATQPMPEH